MAARAAERRRQAARRSSRTDRFSKRLQHQREMMTKARKIGVVSQLGEVRGALGSRGTHAIQLTSAVDRELILP
jgi:hypothetical protein